MQQFQHVCCVSAGKSTEHHQRSPSADNASAAATKLSAYLMPNVRDTRNVEHAYEGITNPAEACSEDYDYD